MHLARELEVVLAIHKGELPTPPEFDSRSAETPYRRYMWHLCNMCWKTDPQQRPDMTAIAREVHGVHDPDKADKTPIGAIPGTILYCVDVYDFRFIF